ncbi:MAG: hypothetical protein J6B85_11045 [Lachnospiraceae bacterium]|nr:hypothetical protein [Lachnospiraceae bacterium]
MNKDGRNGRFRILNLLQDLFSSTLGSTEKKERLNHYGILTNSSIEKEVDAMCNLSQGVMQKGIEIGKSQGMAQGEANGIALKSKEVTLNLLKKGFSYDDISQIVNVDLATIERWAKETSQSI